MTDPILSAAAAVDNAALLNHALAYAGIGWSVIPVVGKKASGFWKPFQDQAADEPTLRRLFARPNITGLAVILGSASGGLACRDYDDAHAYRRWADAHPDLAESLPTVQTSRGYHVYFSGPDGFEKLSDGEYRASCRQYCLLPPSLHPDGPVYRWLHPLPADGVMPVVDPVQTGLSVPEHPGKTQADTQAHSPHTLHVSEVTVSSAISATLPTAPGERNHALWQLARRLKGVMPDATIRDLEPVARDWHNRALPFIATKDWLTSWVEFRTAWARVKRPVGATMAAIAATAKSQAAEDADAIAELSALCRALQEHHGSGRAWPLSCRMAGKLIGVSYETAAKLLKMLCVEGFIELATPAGSKKSRRAAEYRCLEGNQVVG